MSVDFVEDSELEDVLRGRESLHLNQFGDAALPLMPFDVEKQVDGVADAASNRVIRQLDAGL